MTRIAPIRTGDVIQVAEQDYFFGLGTLTLRITRVYGLMCINHGPYVDVDGIPLWSNGYEGEERYAQVRLSGVRHLPERPSSRNAS
ncbi:hypothetical protein [Actinoplanes sp. NPDC026623]|uniref:hypothetical protein n=1 Tax=Actinoplanes sp. NPDC026623 TaxID=3155610 RepID=UPI0033CE849D